ncbi:MAG: zinc-dependent alcohol dehydrogenase family protein [Methylomonas sp.]|jgi:propanol-preferring alcohol dehydrogenase
MKAMLLERICNIREQPTPLKLGNLPTPEPKDHEVLIKVSACGVCHTELDEIEGRTPPPRLPVIPGHQVVGRVVGAGRLVKTLKIGARVGVAWIFSSCGACRFCQAGLENLCPDFLATGRDANGGYAEFMTVAEDFAFLLPAGFSDLQAAPLLCAGAIGYRSLHLAGVQNGRRLGLTGFGASAHLVLQMAKHLYPATEIFVFARNAEEREFARALGAAWAGDTFDRPPAKLDSIIDTTPAWEPVLEALSNLEPGGRLVINAIRKQDDKQCLLKLDYPEHLWREKELKSVANITRNDVKEFLQLAAAMPIQPEVESFTLEQANQALFELKIGKIKGAKVLRIE